MVTLVWRDGNGLPIFPPGTSFVVTKTSLQHPEQDTVAHFDSYAAADWCAGDADEGAVASITAWHPVMSLDPPIAIDELVGADAACETITRRWKDVTLGILETFGPDPFGLVARRAAIEVDPEYAWAAELAEV